VARSAFAASADLPDLNQPWRTPGQMPGPSDEKIAELAKESGLHEDLVRDPVHHMLALKVGRLMAMWEIPEAEREEWVNSVMLSPGYPSMEWCWGNPPPFHTNEELPIIKKNGDYQ
jgi:hypothetical protein